MPIPSQSDIQNNNFTLNGHSFIIAGSNLVSSNTNLFTIHGRSFNSAFNQYNITNVNLTELVGSIDQIETLPFQSNELAAVYDQLDPTITLSLTELVGSYDSEVATASISFVLGSKVYPQFTRLSITPVHFVFNTLGSSSTHTNFFNYYENSARAFTVFTSPGNSSVHNNFRTTGYVYQVPGYYIQNLTELVGCLDSGQTLPFQSNELAAVYDSLIFDHVLNLTELVGSIDSGLAYNSNINQIMTTNIEVLKSIAPVESTQIQIAVVDDVIDSTNINVIANSFVSVTNACSLDNPLLPSLAVDGTVYIDNGTFPGEVPPTGIYIGFTGLNTFGNQPLCNLRNWNINLGFGGGTWEGESLFTNGSITSQGLQVSIFGLNGYCTEAGKRNSNDGIVYYAKGIFGNPNMFKQIQLLATATAGLSIIGGLTPSQTVQTPPSNQWATLSAAAIAVGQVAGMNVSWMAQDAPLTDMFITTGTNAISTLNTLAAQVGAFVVWDGNVGYDIIKPTQVLGGDFIAPDCSLFLSTQFGNVSDITDPIIIFPVNASLGSATITLPTPINLGNERVNKIIPVCQVNPLSSTDTSRPLKLPGSYNQLWYRILANSTVEGTVITTDVNQWFPYDLPITTAEDGTSLAFITPGLFPTTVPDGAFLELGYTENTEARTNNYNQAVAEALTRATAISNSIAGVRYVKTGAGSFSVVFFGAIPLPGQYITISGPNALQVQGLIETVNFSNSGIINVTVGQYALLNFTLPRSLLNTSTLAT